MKVNFRVTEPRNLKIKKENKKPELSNSEIIKLIRFPRYVTRFFYFYFFNLKFPSYVKLSMRSQQIDLIIRNSVFQLSFLTCEFQIPC